MLFLTAELINPAATKSLPAIIPSISKLSLKSLLPNLIPSSIVDISLKRKSLL
jgi:hypothetical protein